MTANGFSSRCLRLPQLGDGRRVPRVAHQVEAAEPLQGADPAVQNRPGEEGERGLGRERTTVGVERLEAGAAHRAGGGLGVETAVGGVVDTRRGRRRTSGTRPS